MKVRTNLFVTNFHVDQSGHTAPVIDDYQPLLLRECKAMEYTILDNDRHHYFWETMYNSIKQPSMITFNPIHSFIQHNKH